MKYPQINKMMKIFIFKREKKKKHNKQTNELIDGKIIFV